MFDKFCVLSLKQWVRHNFGAAPRSSLLLSTTEECYFFRLSVEIYPDGIGESRWTVSGGVGVGHLLDVFTSIDGNSEGVWGTCAKFMAHLFWHKPRLVVLGPKIEALPDDHPSKAQCLDNLSRLFHSAGNWVECERIPTHTLKFWRERGDGYQVAQTSSNLCEAS